MKQRYIVTFPNSSRLKFYCQPEEIRKIFPEAINIEEDNDRSFEEYIKKIKAVSYGTLLDAQGREHWKIPYNNGFVLYRQFVDESDGSYLDGCIYQRFDNIGTTMPCLKDISNPQKFYKLFVEDDSQSDGKITIVSPKYVKRQKAKVVYNKDGYRFWRDDDGRFYAARKEWLPSKYDKDEYMRFHDNDSAIFVSYGTEVAFRTVRWYDGTDEFLEIFNLLKEQNSSEYYEIRKQGYRKKPPEERNVIDMLPKFNLEKEICLARMSTANKNRITERVLSTWLNESKTYDSNMIKKLISLYL